VDQLPEAAAGAARSDAIPDVVALLQALPESQRSHNHIEMSMMSLEDVARATSSSVGSVKQKAHRGYSKPREILTRMGFNLAGPGDPNDK
jgi:RNA polymerase sigma-70 factor (ECF subfamily)